MIFARVSSTTHLLLFRSLFRRVVGSDGSGGNLSQFGFDVGAGTSRAVDVAIDTAQPVDARQVTAIALRCRAIAVGHVERDSPRLSDPR